MEPMTWCTLIILFSGGFSLFQKYTGTRKTESVIDWFGFYCSDKTLCPKSNKGVDFILKLSSHVCSPREARTRNQGRSLEAGTQTVHGGVLSTGCPRMTPAAVSWALPHWSWVKQHLPPRLAYRPIWGYFSQLRFLLSRCIHVNQNTISKQNKTAYRVCRWGDNFVGSPCPTTFVWVPGVEFGWSGLLGRHSAYRATSAATVQPPLFVCLFVCLFVF